VGCAELEAILGPVVLASALAMDQALPSPGLLLRHYAPRTPVECLDNGRFRVAELRRAGQRVGWLTRGPVAVPREVHVFCLPADPIGYGAGLYSALHALDAEGLDCLVVDLPPDTPEWLAVRDRLRRASS
jgi:L-threonylcarbamoyladenylate synthase